MDDHCGWNFPWDPFQFLFSNNSVYHDVHHQTYGIKANFSQPFFTFCTLSFRLCLTSGDHLSGTYMPPPSHEKPKAETEVVVVQEFGNSGTEGSRKRRKSVVSSPKMNGNASPTQNGDISVNSSVTMNGSPKARKVNGTANGIGSRGMLVVGK